MVTQLNDNVDLYLFRYVYRITNYLTSKNIAHNMAIVKGESFSSSSAALRIFVWFRQSIISKRFE